MSNGIGRKRTMGIAVESVYGVAASSPTFVIPLVSTPRVEIVQNKERNVAALGSSYGADSVKNTNRMSNVSLDMKVDENHLPLFFKQKFTISSATYNGEAAVYQHILTYSNTNDGASYTLFIDDDDRTSVVIPGVKFGSLNLVAEPAFLRLEAEGMGLYTSTWTGSTSVTQPNDFVGRNIIFNMGDYSGSKATYNTLTATFNHEFALSDDDVNFVLGNQDISKIFTTEDIFTSEIKALFPNFDERDDYSNNTKKKYDVTITDTARTIGTGSAPYIKFDYPVGYVEGWSEDGELADMLTQNLVLLPVNEVGVSTAPLQITIRNTTASY